MKALILKALSNLKYESTLSGLAVLLGLVGAKLAPELQEAIATAVIGVVGVVKLLMSDADAAEADKKKKK